MLTCLFAPLRSLPLVFTAMKGKSKSNKKVRTIPLTGIPRNRLSLRDKRRIIALRTEGKSREDVQKLLCPSGTEVTIDGQLWRKIWRELDKDDEDWTDQEQMEYLQSKMDELLLKDLEPTETEVAENVQGKEGQDDTSEGQTENESKVSKKAIEQPKNVDVKKMNCLRQN